MVAWSSGPIAGSSDLAAAVEQRRQRLLGGPLDRQRDNFGMPRPVAAIRSARAASAITSLGSVSSQRVVELVRLPPAVDQGGDAARLQHRHIGEDPARAVAHGDGDAVALGDAEAADQGRREPVGVRERGRRRSAARRRPPPPRTAALSTQKASKKIGSVGGRLVTIGAALLVVCRSGSARPSPVTCGEHRVDLAVELARHRRSGSSRWLFASASAPL